MAKINPIMQAIRETTPPEVSRQVDIAVRIANRVYELLEKKAMSQKDLAKKLGKTETEVSRWLSGTHNLTIASGHLLRPAYQHGAGRHGGLQLRTFLHRGGFFRPGEV